MSSLKVLFVTSEVAGLAKAGGLGDVSLGLPLALRRRGIDVRVIMPAYPGALTELPDLSWTGALPQRASIPACRLGVAHHESGLPLYLVGAPALFERAGSPYCSPDGADWADNHVRFARLSLAAADIARGMGDLRWQPDLIRVNDWPAGLTPAYMAWDGTRLPTVLTIHNIAYQGNFDAGQRQQLGIPDEAFQVEGVEFHGRVSFLKAASYYASHVTTVSPTYAREITTEPMGAGLHGLMQRRAERGELSGIVNGIDESWNPESDPHLPHHFAPEAMDGKQANADIVRTGLCLRPSEGPLFGIVSRLVHQKGLDLVAETANDIVARGGQIAVLGMGDPEIEALLSRVSRCNRDDMGVLIGFNEPMARRIVAGSDFTLMPSRFEPCGLTQMQSQRYGALPIAHATGGLADTIDDGRTGFLFSDLSADALAAAYGRAFETFGDEARLEAMRRTAMGRAFGWAIAAEAYEALYCRLLGRDPVPGVIARRSARPKPGSALVPEPVAEAEETLEAA